MYDATREKAKKLIGATMYFLFAWFDGEQVGGAYDLVGKFKTAEAAIAKAEQFTTGDWRFDVQVTDDKLRIIYETNNREIASDRIEEIPTQ